MKKPGLLVIAAQGEFADAALRLAELTKKSDDVVGPLVVTDTNSHDVRYVGMVLATADLEAIARGLRLLLDQGVHHDDDVEVSCARQLLPELERVTRLAEGAQP